MRSALTVILLAGCSLITVQQDPMPALQIRADRPPPGPSRVVVTASSITIAEKIQFSTGSSEILPVSFSLVDEIAKVLTDNPQIELIEIDGHTDSTGTAAINRKLSKKRAEAVLAYLTKKGVVGKRLVAKGFGPDKPIADNKTDEGKEKNRRVEFNILRQGPKKTTVNDD